MLITKPWAVYNEIEEYAADWIENLIALGVIAPGVVDRRSIEDVRPDDYRGFRQVHLFAGIGVWSYALRRTGVPDDTALWTGSCPCQSFSTAGKRTGVDDERHLWPAFYHLMRECRPRKVFGEQVASKDGLGWLDIVQSDMEAAGYACWAVDTCSAGSGAPHLRQRLRFVAEDMRSSTGGVARSDNNDRWSDIAQWGSEGRTTDGRGGAALWVVNSECEGLEGQWGGHCAETGQREGSLRPITAAGSIDRLADHKTGRCGEECPHDGRCNEGGRKKGFTPRPSNGLLDGELADTDGADRPTERQQRGGEQRQQPQDSGFVGRIERPGPTNGFWRDADWLFCRDGKWRPVESEPQQMAHGASGNMGCRRSFPLIDGAVFKKGSGHPIFEGKSRQGMLKGYGNAIDAEATVDFLSAYFDGVADRAHTNGETADDLFGDLIN